MGGWVVDGAGGQTSSWEGWDEVSIGKRSDLLEMVLKYSQLML